MAELPLPRVRVPHPHVRCDAKVLAGSPHVEGSRVPVRRLWTWHRGGAPITWVKRMLLRGLQQYHNEVNYQQTRFNIHLLRKLIELEDRVERLERRDPS